MAVAWLESVKTHQRREGAWIGRSDRAQNIGLLLEMVSDMWREWAAGWKG